MLDLRTYKYSNTMKHSLYFLIIITLLFAGCRQKAQSNFQSESSVQTEESNPSLEEYAEEAVITGKVLNRDFYPQEKELTLIIPFFRDMGNQYRSPIQKDGSFSFRFPSARYVCRKIFLTLSISIIKSSCFFKRSFLSICYTPDKKSPSQITRITPFKIDPTMLVLCFRFSSEKLESPSVKPYAESSMAKSPVPPIGPRAFHQKRVQAQLPR